MVMKALIRASTLALLVAFGCSGGVVSVGVGRVEAAEAEFDDWREAFWVDAEKFGIKRVLFDDAFAGVVPNRSLPDLVLPGKAKRPIKGQAEFIKPPQAYLASRHLARLTVRGRGLMTKHRATLQKIEKEIGVAPQVVLAIWGRETAFGRYRLPHYAIRVLATQAYLGRRKKLFREQLLYALKMLQEGIVEKSKFRSSWAGAVGLTQLMPSEYFDFAYDLDGDGRKDIWSVPDALASAAYQLMRKGWQRGQTWGFEVRLPRQVTCAMDGPNDARGIQEWHGLGVVRVAQRSYPSAYLRQDAFLFSPGGGKGPQFVVLENFMVFKRYNPSDLYALFVGHLADRIAGGGEFIADWGNIRQLKTRRIAAIQAHLKADGFAVGKVDGMIGANTRSQIGQYQLKRQLEVDCWPTQRLLDHMKASVRR